MSPAERDEKIKARWAAYAEHYPERAAVVEATQAAIRSGDLVPDECSIHGPMKPAYDWMVNARVGWRCYPCRRGAS